jgi:hypothetical protein
MENENKKESRSILSCECWLINYFIVDTLKNINPCLYLRNGQWVYKSSFTHSWFISPFNNELRIGN